MKNTPPTQFTCEHCHQPVPYMDAGLYHYEHRNHCPYCLHSKHIMFGTTQLPPCDQPMSPRGTTPPRPYLFTQECEGCGFRWVTYLEDQWATLPPARQTELINAAYTETERLNGTPTAIYAVKPLYATQPPPIPPHALHTRTRVKRRP
jgi:hypothetical protein